MQRKDAASMSSHMGPDIARNTASLQMNSDHTPAQTTHRSSDSASEWMRLL